jgi:hypothetical protein
MLLRNYIKMVLYQYLTSDYKNAQEKLEKDFKLDTFMVKLLN